MRFSEAEVLLRVLEEYPDPSVAAAARLIRRLLEELEYEPERTFR